MLEELKNLNLERMDLDEAIALSAFARILKAEYEHANAEAPAWLDDRTREIRMEIRDRMRDSVAKQIKETEARLESLATPEEKRQNLRIRLEALKASQAGKS